MQKTLGPAIATLAAALWWCSLTTVGFFVVPMLFHWLPTPALAGNMAAHLFTGQTWISVACGMVLLAVNSQRKDGLAQEGRAPDAIIFVVAGLLLALLAEFAVAPRIVARQNLPLWHGVGSAMYLLQWLCAGMAFRQAYRRRAAATPSSARPPSAPGG